jgi:tRNA 2-thiocytidine biosynthesis protein TtcA
MKFIERIRRQTTKTMCAYSLLSKNDRLLIGLSGGKDSLATIDILAQRKPRIPFPFTMAAAHIDIPGVVSGVDREYLREFCESRGIEFIYRSISVDFERDPGKNKCFLCSWCRRKELFQLCRERSCNKLVLGHNLDDVISTLLMNMCYHSNISTMPINVSLFNGGLSIIRPIGEVDEADIVRYAKLRSFEIQGHICAHGKVSSRAHVKSVINTLAAENEQVKRNLFRSMQNIIMEYLV